MAARVASQLHRNFELVGKLLGDLSTGGTTVNVLLQPTYITMRVELVKALAPFPEVRDGGRPGPCIPLRPKPRRTSPLRPRGGSQNDLSGHQPHPRSGSGDTRRHSGPAGAVMATESQGRLIALTRPPADADGSTRHGTGTENGIGCECPHRSVRASRRSFWRRS